MATVVITIKGGKVDLIMADQQDIEVFIVDLDSQDEGTPIMSYKDKGLPKLSPAAMQS